MPDRDPQSANTTLEATVAEVGVGLLPSARASEGRAAIINLSGLEILVLHDGTIELSRETFCHVTSSVGTRAVAGRSTLPTDILCYLVRGFDACVLIDTGMGKFGSSDCGLLPESLARCGIEPADITDVLLTHLHRDHCGGLVTDDGQAAFPNATVHICQNEVSYWSDNANRESAPAAHGRFFDVAQQILEICAWQIAPFSMQAPPTFACGLTVQPLPGHTPGHLGLRLQQGQAELLIWGDVVHCADLQLEDLDLGTRFDSDPMQACRTRRQIVEHCANLGTWIAGAHIDFPGVGRIRTSDNGQYVLEPLGLSSSEFAKQSRAEASIRSTSDSPQGR